MAIIKFTKLNRELIKNLPSDMKAELITFEEVIPDGIMTSLCVNDPFYDKERMDFLNHRPDLLEKMYRVRGRREELARTKSKITIETEEKIQFIKDYPQFKPLIESVDFYEDNIQEFIKIVPIDEYLADEERIDNEDYYNMNSSLKKLKEELDRKNQEAHSYYLDALKFEREGEYLKSQEYCRKALDLVPSNSVYEHKLKKLENR